tara:strand:+ start:235 stop:630 length:396 start_codon:yes stop_codon:yes gene_type:complete
MNPALLKQWVVALVKGGAVIDVSGRIYPDEAPDGTQNPCAVYQMLGADFDINLGAGLDDSKFTIQLRLYASTRAEADSLRAGLAEHLQSSCGAEISPGVRLTHTEVGGFSDDFDPDDGSYGAIFLWLAISE